MTLATFGLVTIVQPCTTLHKSQKDFCKNTDAVWSQLIYYNVWASYSRLGRTYHRRSFRYKAPRRSWERFVRMQGGSCINSHNVGGSICLWNGWKNMVSFHQYSYKNLFGTCARLYKVAQSSQDQKLQVSQAMSKFWQVAASKSFQSLPCLLHSICVTQSSSIYFSNMPREPEQLSVCWCCRHRHQRHPRLFFISVALSNIKIYVCLSIYSISALDWLESHKSSVGCHGTSQSRDSWSNELV